MARTRKFKDALHEVHLSHAAAIGEIAIAWNTLHELFGNIFHMLLSPANHEYCWAAWHSISSDSQQRTILNAVINATLKDAPNAVLQELKWVLHRVAPQERNASIHTPFMAIIEEGAIKYVPSHQSGHRYATQLKGKDLKVEFKTYHLRIIAAITFVRAINQLIFEDAKSPLPSRPIELMSEQEKKLAATGGGKKTQRRRRQLLPART